MDTFKKYGDQYSLDYLLMMAKGYQESRLNQSVRSRVGAIGIMQLMPATGKSLNVGDIRQVEPNIHGGVKYTRKLMDEYLGNEPLDDLNKGFFTLASYNAGPSRIRQLRREAARRDLDPNVWFGQVERIASETHRPGDRLLRQQHLQVLHRLSTGRRRGAATGRAAGATERARLRPLMRMWSRLWAGPIDWQPILMALLPTVLVAWLAATVARRLTRAALKALVGDTLAPSSPLVRAPMRLVFVATFLLVSAIVIFPALELAGLRPSAGRNLRELASWLFGPGLRVVLIALVAYALHRATDLLVKRFEFEVNEGTTLDGLERAKRARTLGSAVNKVATALIVGIGGVMILNEVGVNVAPLLTGAGIAGVAVGFGAQTLVRDVLSGFFLLLEDQVRVGDSAAINGTAGVVEQLNLRTIVLRDVQGTVHVFPNGAINTLANQSKDFSRYVIDLNIAYDEDPDRVADAAREVDHELRKDRRFEALHPRTDPDPGRDGVLRMVDAVANADQDRSGKAVARRARVPEALAQGAEPSWGRGSLPGFSSPVGHMIGRVSKPASCRGCAR